VVRIINPSERERKKILEFTINFMYRWGDRIETGVVSATYRCCAVTCHCSRRPSEEEDEYVGLGSSSSFEWRPQGSLGGLHLLQPTYVSLHGDMTKEDT
jgi:hypothetical protein